MSNDKEIRIRAVLDASTFDKGVQEIQEKIKKLTQQNVQGTGSQQTLAKSGGLLGKYAQQAFGDFSKESQKQMEDMFRAQRAEAMNQNISIKGKQAELAKMAKIDGEMTKQQQQRVDLLKKELELLKEKHRQTLNTAAETQKALDKMRPAGEPSGGGPGGGGGGGQPSPEPNDVFKGFLGKMLKQIGVGAVISGAVNGVAQAIDDRITRERKINMNNAASLGMASREMREGFEGRGSRGMFFMPERARAMRAAAGEQGNQGMWDTAKAWGGTALQGIGIGTMALTGWTGIGLGVGAGLTAAGTGLKGGIIGDERSRAAMFDRQKFNSMMTKEGMEKYEQNLAAEKAKDPRRVMAQEYFEQNRQNIAQMQKLMGLGTDADLMGGGGVGLLQRNMQYGNQYGGVNFNQQTIQDQMAALASGGAMTAGIRDMSGAAATYNRQFNLSNAGQTMGRIQGNTGMNSSLTDLAYQRILTEAVRLGVDASTMPRELEKMTQITAELTTAGGVNATGMGDIFGAGVLGYNQKALSAAASATQNFVSTGKEAGGWEGQMGMGFLQGAGANIIGRKLSTKEMNFINQISSAELDESGYQRIADQLGISTDQAKQLMLAKDQYKQGRTGEEDKAYKDLGEFIKGKTPDQIKEAISGGAGGKLFTAAQMARGQTHGDFLQKDQATQMAEIITQANVAAGNTGAMDFQTAAEKVAATKTRREGRAAYVEEGAEATGDMARMDALNEQLDNLKNAARNHTKYAEEYNKQFELMVQATKNGASAMESVANQLSTLERKMAEDAALRGDVPAAKPGQ